MAMDSTQSGTPIWASSSRRRGEAEARYSEDMEAPGKRDGDAAPPVSKNDDIRRSIAAERTYLTLRRSRTNCSRAYTQGQSSALTSAGSRKVRVGGRFPVRALSHSWSSCARP